MTRGKTASPEPAKAPPVLRWQGQVPRFSRLREGGPGRPASLALLVVFGLVLLVIGKRVMEAEGISSAGPAAMLFGVCVLGFVVLWVFVKAVLRSREVTFVVDARGVAIRPSAQQRKLDKRLFWLSMFVFWATWRGAVWTAWAPVTRWKEVRRVEYDDAARQILVRGGAWDIRLMCTAENYAGVRELIEARRKQRGT